VNSGFWTRGDDRARTSRQRAGAAISAGVVVALVALAAVNLLAPATLAVEYETVSMTHALSTQVGLFLLLCAAIYALPMTSFLGVVLITAVAAGVVLAHLRLGEIGGASQVFAVAICVLSWLGLYLRRDDGLDAPSRKVDRSSSD